MVKFGQILDGARGIVDLSVAYQNSMDLYFVGCVARRDEVAQGACDCRALPSRVFDYVIGFCDFVCCGSIHIPLAITSDPWYFRLGDHLADPCDVSKI